MMGQHHSKRSTTPLKSNLGVDTLPPYNEVVSTSKTHRPRSSLHLPSSGFDNGSPQLHHRWPSTGHLHTGGYDAGDLPPYTSLSTTPSASRNASTKGVGSPPPPHPTDWSVSYSSWDPKSGVSSPKTPPEPKTENALESLRKNDTVFVVDDSSSMRGALWEQARDALSRLAEVSAKYDVSGIDVHFFNDKRSGLGLTSAVAVKRLFDTVAPRGITPMGEKLESLLLPYLAAIERAKDKADAGDSRALNAHKPVNFIVITDGAPTDDPEPPIVAAARRLDAKNFPLTQVGIQFVQIGHSPKATAFLKELDDGLAMHYGIRDMVDTTPYSGKVTAELLLKVLLGGINRRVDKRGAGGFFR